MASLSWKIIGNYVILFVILIVLGMLYKRFEEKRLREENRSEQDIIQKYLLNEDTDLEKSNKPILWIHVPYEYNARHWASFGSRSSSDLNQPYLYLCVKSIIEKCEESFTICIIDDKSFDKLVPDWSIQMNRISTPVLEKVRALGLMKLLFTYGGMLCPVSFLCMKDLIGLYEQGTTAGGSGFFACETNNHNVTNQQLLFYPNIMFSGATKENETVEEFIHYIQHLISSDYTAESVFLGEMNSWLQENKQVKKINGMEIGVKARDDTPILLEDLISQKPLNLYPGTYGILIPSREILSRRKYEWFARLSHKQLLESDTILGNYFLLDNTTSKTPAKVIEKFQTQPNWVSFWKVPSDAPLWGLKPNFLGDNLRQLKYPVN
jgi:hypothetical protein